MSYISQFSISAISQPLRHLCAYAMATVPTTIFQLTAFGWNGEPESGLNWMCLWCLYSMLLSLNLSQLASPVPPILSRCSTDCYPELTESRTMFVCFLRLSAPWQASSSYKSPCFISQASQYPLPSHTSLNEHLTLSSSSTFFHNMRSPALTTLVLAFVALFSSGLHLKPL